jgi:hypothetical protein
MTRGDGSPCLSQHGTIECDAIGACVLVCLDKKG